MLPIPPSVYLRLLSLVGGGRRLQDRILCLGALGNGTALAVLLLSPGTSAPAAIPLTIAATHGVCAIALLTLRLRRAAIATALVAGLGLFFLHRA